MANRFTRWIYFRMCSHLHFHIKCTKALENIIFVVSGAADEFREIEV